jgi:hypothetical protein
MATKAIKEMKKLYPKKKDRDAAVRQVKDDMLEANATGQSVGSIIHRRMEAEKKGKE